MPMTRTEERLRWLLWADAGTCIACGAQLTLGAQLMSQWMNIPVSLALAAGAALFPIGLFIGGVGMRFTRSAPALWAVVLGNVGWASASVWLLAGRVITPNSLGTGFIAAQAALVLAFALAEARAALSAQRAQRGEPLPAAR